MKSQFVNNLFHYFTTVTLADRLQCITPYSLSLFNQNPVAVTHCVQSLHQICYSRTNPDCIILRLYSELPTRTKPFFNPMGLRWHRYELERMHCKKCGGARLMLFNLFIVSCLKSYKLTHNKIAKSVNKIVFCTVSLYFRDISFLQINSSFFHYFSINFKVNTRNITSSIIARLNKKNTIKNQQSLHAR